MGRCYPLPNSFRCPDSPEENIEVTEVEVNNPECLGTRLGEIRLPGDALILSLKRDNTVMVPDGDTVLRLRDHLGLIGSPKSVEKAIALLNG
ncbi:MAG: TrkA C-terminal domain-containing protein [Chloroflexota bacterium]|nr:MAG: TrkA C-terminal domain-containing protein [Chloroflexota bacterium]